MIPLLIISKDLKTIKTYVENLKDGNLFFEIIPLTKEFSIDDIKNLKKETKIFNPKTRIYFLQNFHQSSLPAQNSFLKLLEEPPSNVQFILSTDNKNSLLPTIISRVKIVKLEKTGVSDPAKIQLILPFKKIPFSEFKVADKESAKNILLQLISFFRGRLVSDKKSANIIIEILRLNSLLKNNNLNPQLTVDQVLIFIHKVYKIN